MARIRLTKPDEIKNFKAWSARVARSGDRRRGRRAGGVPVVCSGLEALLWVAPALVVIAFVFAYGIYRLIEETLHRDGAYVGLGNLRIVFKDPLFSTVVNTTSS